MAESKNEYKNDEVEMKETQTSKNERGNLSQGSNNKKVNAVKNPSAKQVRI